MNTHEQDIVYFAKTNFRSREQVFGIKRVDRRQHVYVIGQTGTGKSTFLKNIALQDIKSGRGICIVDPHGEFVEEVLTMVPPERMNDVIYFNPADSEYPVGFNVLEVPDTGNVDYRTIAASGLMGIFTKIWANVWSARMEYILNNAVLALLEVPGTTLLGIQRILIDKNYRKEILSHVKNPQVLAFWKQEYDLWEPRFRNEAIAPIQNKVGQFLSSPLIRNIVGQPESTLSMYDAMNDEKIILVNVSKGRIGEDNSQLLGAMVITKLQLAAMERVRIPEEERKDFYLYVDEFQNFATDSFSSILSEARKYRLNLVMAHQYIGQLVTDTSTKVRDAVFGNVGTMIVFRIGATDAEFLEKEFAPEVAIEDLVGLPNHRIFLKLMIDQVRSRPFSASTLPPLAIDGAEGSVDNIIEASRNRYARGRHTVEENILQWSGFADASQELQRAAPPRPRRTEHTPPPIQPDPVSKKETPVSSPKPADKPPEKHVSLSALHPKAPDRGQIPIPGLSSQHHKRTVQKKSPQKIRLSELRSVLHGVLEKRPQNLEERRKKEKPTEQGGALKPGESITLR